MLKGSYPAGEPSLLKEYLIGIEGTDRMKAQDVNPVLMGLYGEVGGIMATLKKYLREGAAYPGHKKAAEEEFGDTLWYFSALCRRLNVSVEAIFTEVFEASKFKAYCVTGDLWAEQVELSDESVTSTPDQALFLLGESASDLLRVRTERDSRELLLRFASSYVDALHLSSLSLSEIARKNVEKVRGSFIKPNKDDLPTFDYGFTSEERIPDVFRIKISQRKSGKSFLSWNGVFIGDPLSDSHKDSDGYRFHDVFHLAYAAILHWSPVFRALIKQKRKSSPKCDEEEDGGRAIVAEEGLTAWIFSKSKELNYFEGQTRVSLDVLKIVKEFVAGYEVQECPLTLWEEAILEGYSVFRQLRASGGGWVVCNRTLRTISFEPLREAEHVS